MALTDEQQVEFERYASAMLNAAIGGSMDAQKEYASLGHISTAGRLAKFRAWAAEERAQATHDETAIDARVDREKTARAARAAVLIEIEALTRL